MNESLDSHVLWTLLVGLIVIASGFIDALCRRLHLPALVGYLLVGMALSLLNSRWTFMSEDIRNVFSFLADLGVIALLFKVGLESRTGSLIQKLPEAVPVWLGNVAASFLLGFGVCYFILSLQLIPALVVATALTATSVGVSVAAWQSSNQALSSDNGQLLIDVAELDDISAIALMTLLFALIPVLHNGHAEALSVLGTTGAGFVAKLIFFIGLCYLFARYFEPRISSYTARMEPEPQYMLTVAGVGFVIAAIAGWLGFSLAIGALFAGLIFSRDPKAVKTEKSFIDIYDFLTPFFFINIGLNVLPAYVTAGAGVGVLLLLAAVAGKFIGAGMPALIFTGMTGAVLIGISLVPRAEIAMIVVHKARQLGDWAMPGEIYAAMVFVTIITCISAPPVLYRLLKRWPQTVKE